MSIIVTYYKLALWFFFFFFNLSRRSDSQTKEWAVGVVGSGGLSVNETDVKE